jgi:hypothetical protein
MNKKLLGHVILVILLSNIITLNVANDDEMNKFFTKVGFDSKEDLERDDFIQLIDFLLTKATNAQDSIKYGMREFIPKHVQHIPEKFKRDDIVKYLNEDLLRNVMSDFIDSRFPKGDADKMKEQLFQISQKSKQEKDQGKTDL